MGVLRSHFRPEFLNRLDEIIIFNPLKNEEIKAIVRLQLEKLKQLAEGQDITLEFTDKLVDFLAKEGFQPEFGARELKRKIQSEIGNKLAREMLSGNIKEGSRVRVKYTKSKGVEFQQQ